MEIKSLSLEQCWKMVNRTDTLEKVFIAEEWVKKANATEGEKADLMCALAFIYREIKHQEKFA